MTRYPLYLCTSVAISALATPVLAQSTTPTPATSSAATPNVSDPTTAEIVVTANKREQKLNDVGLTITVVSGQALKDQHISSLADLAQTIPSLSYATSAFNTPVYTLRGVGFYETSLAAYPTVSVYVDEVALPFPALTTHSAFDLERVEVLKGPQGTLFGQNATGGAINYIAAKPTDKLAAGFNISYGRFNEVIAEAYVSGPITSTLKARLSGRLENADGWQVSNSRPNDRNGDVRNYMGRFLLDFQPSSSVHFLLNLNGWKDGSQTEAPQYIGIQPQSPILAPALANAKFSPENDRAADWNPGLPHADNRFLQGSLRGDIDLTSNITLTSITAYEDYKQNQGEDGDGLPISTLDVPIDQGRIKSFSQEVRFSNGSHHKLRWVLGGNYEHSSVDQTFHYDITSSTASTTLGAVYGYPISYPITISDQTMRNYAFFGNAEYDLLDKLTIKGGVRYTNARRNVNECNETSSGLPGDAGPFFYNLLLGGAFGPYVNGECFAVNDLGTTQGSVPAGAPGAYVGTLQEHNVSWRGGVDYKVRPGFLLYATVSRGYKAGSYPTVSASTFTQYQPVIQESVLAFEGGLKATLLDRKVQLNAAGFYYDYSNKQLRSKIDAPPFGILDVLRNVPKSTIWGFEGELVGHPTRGLTIGTNFTYLNAKINQFTGYNTVGVLTDFAGSRVPFTPKYQAGGNIDYAFPMGATVNGFVGSNLTFRSDTVSVVGGDVNPATASPQNKTLFGIAAYTLVDLRAGVKLDDDRLTFSVWGKNIFNEYYWNNVTAGDAIARYAGKPATYGVSVAYRY